MVLKVENLEDGDARAAFKNINLDIRQYRKIQMEVHAAALPGISSTTAILPCSSGWGPITGIIIMNMRFLYCHTTRRYDNNRDNDRVIVWPLENRLDIELDIFQQLKTGRNQQMQIPGSNYHFHGIFANGWSKPGQGRRESKSQQCPDHDDRYPESRASGNPRQAMTECQIGRNMGK
jgi:cell surface protein SprA